MLKSIDTLLGFALVMLVASMAVTVMTEIWTALINSRGVHLRDGLAALVRQIDPDFSPADAKTVIEHMLTHPLIAEGGRLGSLVHRGEFTRLILELASPGGPEALPDATRQALQRALCVNGIPDPAAALGKIQDLALSIERSHPSLPMSARHDLAILHAAPSLLVAKINGWFDPTIDRISARFTSTTRRAALAGALLVTASIHLDSVSLIGRLHSDETLRRALVQQATAAAALPAGSVADIERLVSPALFPAPSNFAQWRALWTWGTLPGTVLSVLLLSLGAPFWFEMLKNLLRLRSTLTANDDGQRESRQSPAAPIRTFFDLSSPNLLKEKADLQLGEAATHASQEEVRSRQQC